MQTKALIIIIMLLAAVNPASAFKTDFMEVNFATSTLSHNGKNFELVEIKSKVKRNHREINYYCLSDNLTAVVFRLLVSDNGKFLKLIKYTSKK